MVTNSNPTITKKIETALVEKRSVYVQYSADGGGTSFRKVDPQEFEASKNGKKVREYCHLRKDVRSFFLHKITRVEDYDWNASLEDKGK